MEEQNSSGVVSPWLVVVLLVVILIAAGFFGWLYLNGQTATTTSAPSAAVPVKTSTAMANLKTYENATAGFEFKYPANILVNPADPKGAPVGTFLIVSIGKMSEIGDQPSGMDQENAIKDKAALEKGDASVRVGWSMGGTLLNLVGAVGKEQVRLSAFDTTVSEIDRTAIIYKGDYRIYISLAYNDTESLIKNNPKYFSTDPTFGNTWKDGQTDDFYTDLKAGKTDKVTQDWYKLFDQVIGTFKVL